MYKIVFESLKKLALSISPSYIVKVILNVFQRPKFQKRRKRKKKPYLIKASSTTGTERLHEVTRFSFMSIKYYKEKISENTFNEFDNNL